MPPWHLATQVDAFRAMLAGEVELQPVVDCLERPAYEPVFDGFSILVGSPYATVAL